MGLHLRIRHGDPLFHIVQAYHRLGGSFDLLVKSDGNLYFSVDRVRDRNYPRTLPALLLRYLSFPVDDQLLQTDCNQTKDLSPPELLLISLIQL